MSDPVHSWKDAFGIGVRTDAVFMGAAILGIVCAIVAVQDHYAVPATLPAPPGQASGLAPPKPSGPVQIQAGPAATGAFGQPATQPPMVLRPAVPPPGPVAIPAPIR